MSKWKWTTIDNCQEMIKKRDAENVSTYSMPISEVKLHEK